MMQSRWKSKLNRQNLRLEYNAIEEELKSLEG